MSDPPLVRVEDVSYRYEGSSVDSDAPWAVQNVSLTIQPGELVALVGQNGSGKTTLAKHLNGLLKPTTGRVLVGATDTRDAPVGLLARQVGYVFQNPDHQLFLPSVRREVAYGPEQLGLEGEALEARVRETLERFELVAVAEHHPAMLGRGMRRLTALAAIAALGPRLLVLDEPTGGLDRRLTARLLEMLLGLVRDPERPRAVVLITHEMTLAAEAASRVVVLRAGEVVADQPPERLFDLAAGGELLERAGIAPPSLARVAARMAGVGMPPAAGIEAFCRAYLTVRAERAASRSGR